MTATEIDQIAAYLGTDREEVARTSVRRVGRRMSLRERPNGDCVLYADGCLVYPVRPEQCRTFPFWREHLRTRGTWDRLHREECEGIGTGRQWTRAEIDLLSGRGRPRRRHGEGDLRRALNGLRALYAELDRTLAPLMATCTACGRCCDFATDEHVLYVTELEQALLAADRGPGNSSAPPSRCRYQAGPVCTAREVRPLGCRTFFCDARAGERGRELHETFRRRLAPLREASGLEPCYRPLVLASEETTSRD